LPSYLEGSASWTGIYRTAIWPRLIFFINIQAQPDGILLKRLPAVTKPGDYIVLRTEMDCFVAFSACPQDIVSIQGQGDNTPRDAELRILIGGFPQGQ